MPARIAPVALALAVALSACSSSDDDDIAGPVDPADAADDAGADPDPGTVAEGYVTGGASCTTESTTAITTTDGDTAPVGVPGEAEVGPDAGAPDEGVAIDAPDEADGPGPCAASPTALGPATARPSNGTGRLAFDRIEATLAGAILSVADGGELADADDLYLLLHDGETRIAASESVEANGDRTSGTAYGVYDATVALSIGLLPGDAGDGPAGRTYDVATDARDLDGPGTEGLGIAAEPSLAADLDGDGEIAPGEFFEPTAGQLVWAGTAEAPSLSFTFVLEDGRSIEGHWEGGLELVD